MKLRLATDEEAIEVYAIVEEWWNKQNGKFMFEDAGRVSRAAVAEFLANQRGITTFESKVGMECNDV